MVVLNKQEMYYDILFCPRCRKSFQNVTEIKYGPIYTATIFKFVTTLMLELVQLSPLSQLNV